MGFPETFCLLIDSILFGFELIYLLIDSSLFGFELIYLNMSSTADTVDYNLVQLNSHLVIQNGRYVVDPTLVFYFYFKYQRMLSVVTDMEHWLLVNVIRINTRKRNCIDK